MFYHYLRAAGLTIVLTTVEQVLFIILLGDFNHHICLFGNMVGIHYTFFKDVKNRPLLRFEWEELVLNYIYFFYGYLVVYYIFTGLLNSSVAECGNTFGSLKKTTVDPILNEELVSEYKDLMEESKKVNQEKSVTVTVDTVLNEQFKAIYIEENWQKSESTSSDLPNRHILNRTHSSEENRQYNIRTGERDFFLSLAEGESDNLRQKGVVHTYMGLASGNPFLVGAGAVEYGMGSLLEEHCVLERDDITETYRNQWENHRRRQDIRISLGEPTTGDLAAGKESGTS